ncbi:chemotaxis response regulator protein-glutamate methylesterase [Evansella sp. AB-P1]|uniref:protein-glutamate methylesterase/protein-glutamine glutaminase n=1 Tax=Evansella sp. AB-P1 TaxID=3037653 RepID=UPI00241DD44E|nr:chemotaxis response regulator protein-glutamate methylesterase [Evansella sp. AB-P1]MDG5788170.1 chemotaxis response regulator protein-glutamate methylesterase [Evansella sp. AB-P1]
MINVLVVDDSAFMRKVISDLLKKDSRIEVIATARNGEDAIEKIKKYNPDVVTLDVEMPIIDGLEALKIIMKEYPKPVIMLSSTTTKGADNTIRAMDYGAFDFISKPSGPISLDIHKVQNDLIEKVIHASTTSLTKLLSTNEKAQQIDSLKVTKVKETPTFHSADKIFDKLGRKGIVAIGTSTGGPKALQQVLTKLPADFPYPILIVQHMPAGFTKSLSNRLNELSNIEVKEAEDGEIIKKGVAYIAPGGYHLKVRGIGTSVAVQLDQSPAVNGHRPSVDALFHSLAQLLNYHVMAVVLTGMGSDGTKGLIDLSNNKKVIAIAESSNSAVVYGMPRAAIESKRVNVVVDLEQVASTIIQHCH